MPAFAGMSGVCERMRWDREVDVLIFGAGMGGMCAALFAALEGLDVLLCEKTDQVGGTTATSAGTVWIPGPLRDDDPTPPRRRRYLDAEIGERGERALRDAFLDSGPAPRSSCCRPTEAKFPGPRILTHYHPNSPGLERAGASPRAAALRRPAAGRGFRARHQPIAPFMVLGGLMLGRDDIPPFVRPPSRRWRRSRSCRPGGLPAPRRPPPLHPRGTRLRLGNALVARLLFSMRECARAD